MKVFSRKTIRPKRFSKKLGAKSLSPEDFRMLRLKVSDIMQTLCIVGTATTVLITENACSDYKGPCLYDRDETRIVHLFPLGLNIS